MSITEWLKGSHEMKNLQTKLKTMQNKKQARKSLLEPLHEQAKKIILGLEEEKTRIS
jgi:hypothetical protein